MGSTRGRFQFRFALHYAQSVENQLYNISTSEYTDLEHVIQQKSQNAAVCLLCLKLFEFPVSPEDLDEHFKSDEHNNATNQIEFEIYHKMFLDMDEKMQLQQIYFLPHDYDNLKCTVCDVIVHLDDVKSHCLAQTHREMDVEAMEGRFFSLNEIDNDDNDELLPDLDYSKQCQATVEVDILNNLIETKQISPLIITKHTNCNYCLLCDEIVVDENLRQHVHTSHHIGHQKTSNTVRLYYYHMFWIKADPDLQTYHKQFGYKRHRVKCLFCNTTLSYHSILKHIHMFPCAIIKRNHPFYDISFEDEYEAFYSILDFPLTYSDEVKHIIYPEEIMSEVHKIDGIPSYTIQKLDKGACCLLCPQLLEDADSLQSILQHVSSKSHSLAASQIVAWEKLAAYHKFWLRQETAIQLQQNNFQPKKLPHLKCHICELKVPYTGAVQHIRQGCAPGISKFVQNNGVRQEDCADECKEDEASSFENVEFDETVEDLEEEPQYLENNMNTAPTNEPDGQQPSSSTDITTFSILKPLSTKKYTEDVKNLLYPASIRRISSMCGPNTDFYYLQKIKKNEVRCFVCDKIIYGSVELHLNSRAHTKLISYPDIIDFTLAYHNYWLSQPADLQMNQVHYVPLSCKKLKCVECLKCLLFKDVINHNCVYLREPIPPLECKSKITQTYFKRIDELLHPKGLKTVTSKYIDISIAQCRGGRIVCLICSTQMLRNYDYIENHFNNPTHIKHMTVERIANVIEYHNYWTQKPANKQINQIQYLLNHATGKLKCQTCEAHITYEDVDAHSSACEVKNAELLRLKNKLKNADFNGGRARNDSVGSARQCSESRDSVAETQTSSDSPVPLMSIRFIPRDRPLGDDHHVASPSREKDSVQPNQNTQKDRRTPRSQRHRSTDNLENEPVNAENRITNGLKDLKIAEKDKKMEEESSHTVHPSVEDKDSKDILKLLPSRFKNHAKYLSIFSDKLKCTSCNIFLMQRIDEVIKHVISDAHLNAANMTLVKYKYYCEICSRFYGNENAWSGHLVGPKSHQAKISSLGPSRRARVQEYECIECKMILFGDGLSVTRHKQSFPYKTENKRNKGGGVALSDGVKRLLQNRDVIHQKAAEFEAKALKILELDSKGIDMCLKAIEHCASSIYPNCKAYAFGSRVAGAGNESSDLDIFLDVGNMYAGLQSQEPLEQQVILNKVKKIFATEKAIFTHITAVSGARTPILKFVHIDTNMDCDLSFRHGLSIENTKYVKMSFELQPIFRSAMLVLKKWASLVNLREEITSYAFCMMFLFQLQLQGYLLPLHKLRTLTGANAPVIDGWETIDYNLSIDDLKKHVVIYNGSIFELVLEFFRFYSRFTFDTEVVCPLLGRTILKSKFTQAADGSGLPNEMESYRRKLLEDPDSVFRSESAMCVQDPFDLSHNLTKAVPKHYVLKFQKLCDLTKNHILH